jgi:hypothetical protein
VAIRELAGEVESGRKAEPDGYAPTRGRRMEKGAAKLFFGYSRVSTEEQAEHRNGLEAQRAAIDAEAERRVGA